MNETLLESEVEKVYNTLEVDRDRAKDIVKSVRKNLSIESKKNEKEWSAEEENKFARVIIEKLCNDYIELKRYNVEKPLDLALLKWSGYSKNLLLNKITELIFQELTTQHAEEITFTLKHLEYNQLRKIYKDLLRKYDKVDMEKLDKFEKQSQRMNRN